VRIGTAALAARGFTEDAFRQVADVIAEALTPAIEAADLARLGACVDALAQRFPLYDSLRASP
jgi:glycine hydroxymethyltransferase